MLSAYHKELVQVFTPVASAIASITAIIVAIWLNILQRRIQKDQRKIQEGQFRIQQGQLKQALFDKRFAVFQSCEKHLVRIIQSNGALDMADLQLFSPEVERAEFLFGADVVEYMKELREKSGDAYVKAIEAKHLVTMGKDSTAQQLHIIEMMKDFCGPMVERRRAVFAPYLKLEG